MRKTILSVVSAAALAVPLVAFGATPASAAAGTKCTTTTGKATFNPALPKIGSTKKVLSTITSTGPTKNCTGGGVKSGAVNGKFKFSKPGNCQTLAQGSGGASNGTVTIKWNTGKTSTIASTIKQSANDATKATVSGKVTAGLFKGLKSSVPVQFTLSQAGGDCVHGDLHYVTFKSTGPLTIHA